MKLFVFAVQCAGRTTIAKHLRGSSDLPIVEMDERIVELNNGVWPKDLNYKETVLIPKILEEVSAMKAVIFFENHMSSERTTQLKEAGFRILAIEVSREELLRRNRHRMEEEGYEDASVWIDSELANLEELKSQNLVERVVDGERSPMLVANEIKEYACSSQG